MDNVQYSVKSEACRIFKKALKNIFYLNFHCNPLLKKVDKIIDQKNTINLFDDEDDAAILYDSDNFNKKSREQIKDIIFDFDYSTEHRVIAFSIWHNQPDNIILEISNKLTCMYLISGTKYIRDFFIAIISTPNIQDIIKIEFAKNLMLSRCII